MRTVVRLLAVGFLAAVILPTNGQVWPPQGCTGIDCIFGTGPGYDWLQGTGTNWLPGTGNDWLQGTTTDWLQGTGTTDPGLDAMTLAGLKDIGGGSSDEETDPLGGSGPLSEMKPELMAALGVHGQLGGSPAADPSASSGQVDPVQGGSQPIAPQLGFYSDLLNGVTGSQIGNSAGPGQKAMLMRLLQNMTGRGGLFGNGVGLGGSMMPGSRPIWRAGGQLWPWRGPPMKYRPGGSVGAGGFPKKGPLGGVMGRGPQQAGGMLGIPVSFGSAAGGKTGSTGSCRCRRQCQWPERDAGPCPWCTTCALSSCCL